MRRLSLSTVLALLLCTPFFFNLERQVAARQKAKKADIQGKITKAMKIKGNPRGILLKLLIRGKKMPNTNYNVAWVEISKKTVIRKAGKKALLKDLTTGVNVRAKFTGAVRESFPIQAVASEIVILNEKK